MVSNNKSIVFPSYQFAGLSNQIMEIEIKAGLALLAKKSPMKNCEFVPLREGEFSWNRHDFKMPQEATQWFREWSVSYR
jgi:hypothetical protein